MSTPCYYCNHDEDSDVCRKCIHSDNYGKGTVIVTFPLPADNEATESPYWLIIDPRKMMKPCIDQVAGMITGPFFSREEAQGPLEARRHAFSARAEVYCHSGYASSRYKQAWRDSWRRNEDVDG